MNFDGNIYRFTKSELEGHDIVNLSPNPDLRHPHTDLPFQWTTKFPFGVYRVITPMNDDANAVHMTDILTVVRDTDRQPPDAVEVESLLCICKDILNHQTRHDLEDQAVEHISRALDLLFEAREENVRTTTVSHMLTSTSRSLGFEE